MYSFQNTPCLDGHIPLSMDECATSVMLGNTVCAPREYAPFCIIVTRFGIPACRIASERSPSIEIIMTRRTEGINVGVGVGDGVSFGVGVAVKMVVGVKVGVSVAVAVCVAVTVLVGMRKDRPEVLGI